MSSAVEVAYLQTFGMEFEAREKEAPPEKLGTLKPKDAEQLPKKVYVHKDTAPVTKGTKTYLEKCNPPRVPTKKVAHTPRKTPLPVDQKTATLVKKETRVPLKQMGKSLPTPAKHAEARPAPMVRFSQTVQKKPQERKAYQETKQTHVRKEKSRELHPHFGGVKEREEEKEEGGGQKQESIVEEIEAVAKKAKKSRSVFPKPQLAKPRLGMFPAYYMLTKQMLLSDRASLCADKQEITAVDEQITIARKERMDALRKALAKESAAKRWGVFAKFMSWIASLTSVITGVALMATGVGAIAGAMLFTGGVITITNQIMQMTGAWRKIQDKLPGDNEQKKASVIAWMQIGITVLCLILAGAGVVFGGFAQVGQAASLANRCMQSFGLMGLGVATIGHGVVNADHSEKMSHVKEYEKRLAWLRHRREDLVDLLEEGLERNTDLYQSIVRFLERMQELFVASQRINRR